MNKLLKKALCLTIALCLILSFALSVSAAPSKYSTSANSGKRGEVCTTLTGTSADSYYTGSYEYANLADLSSSSLLSTLRYLMGEGTHKVKTSYDDCRDYAPMTDCENGGNGSSFVTLYTSYVANYKSDLKEGGGSRCNREHVWPKKLGGFETSGPGSDLHHIRPTENKTNGDRGSLLYGNVTSNAKTSKGNLSNQVGGTKNSTYFEPLDNVKGDVARICLYVYVRWGGDSKYSCNSLTKVFQSVDVLLEWCEMDPVDTWEMGRNEVVSKIQGNRNVFIDYPELAWIMLGKEVPSDMTTPSGNAKSGNVGTGGNTDSGNTGTGAGSGNTDTGNTGTGTGSGNTDSGNTGSNNDNTGSGNAGTGSGSTTACEHKNTVIFGARAATCEDVGYTGDTKCYDCKAVISYGYITPTEEHAYGEEIVIKEATDTEDGTAKKTCEKCGGEIIIVIDATGEEDLGFFARIIAFFKNFFANIFGKEE